MACKNTALNIYIRPPPCFSRLVTLVRASVTSRAACCWLAARNRHAEFWLGRPVPRTGRPSQNSACARGQPAGSQAARWPAAAAGRGPNRLSYRIIWADFPIRLLMSSTAGTEPAATSEQPARSPAKARKYNFGRPGGPRKSRCSSLEHNGKNITKMPPNPSNQTMIWRK